MFEKNNKKENFSYPDECSVCMEKYDEKYLTRTLPCGHSFHTTCIGLLRCLGWYCKRESGDELYEGGAMA